MSGIAGIFHPDGRPVATTELERMAEVLAHRGPDGSAVWSSGATGLACVMLNTTPESRNERLPLVIQNEDLVLTADARLDNRDELFEALNWQDRPSGRISDGELILGAYRKWGESCPKKLLGDFAFAIWDGKAQKLFCARDPFGVRPFYYGHWNGGLYFASEIKALLALPGTPQRLNETRIADYLGGMLDDPIATFYQDILRLPAAHCLVIGKQGLRIWQYYTLDPHRELHLASDTEYAEAFRELFIQAVRCRLRGASPLGVLLSGGLDSSAVACTARQALGEQNGSLLAFSTIFKEAVPRDERLFIQAILAHGRFEPHWVNSDHTSPLYRIEDLFRYQDEPFYAPNLAITRELRTCIRDHGVRVLLDGHDGDTTVSHGFGYLKELAQSRRWLTLAREMYGLSRMYGESAGKPFWRLFRTYELAHLVARSRSLQLARKVFRKRIRPYHKHYNGQPVIDKKPRWARLIQHEFIRQTGLLERRKDWKARLPDTAPGEREQHYRGLSSGLQQFALEVLDREAAYLGIEPRYPFWDRRLVEFCLALPPEQKLHHGWSRVILRRAMAGILPYEVQWRRDKWNFYPVFLRGLKVLEGERLDKLLNGPTGAANHYIDFNALGEAYTLLRNGRLDDNPREVRAIWLAVSLALWLRWRELT